MHKKHIDVINDTNILQVKIDLAFPSENSIKNAQFTFFQNQNMCPTMPIET